MFKVEPQYTVYRIQLSTEDFNDLWDYSAHLTHDFSEYPPENIDDQIAQIDCDVVDYNPMFGDYIFFQLGKEDDTLEKWAEIERIVTSYIELAREWKKEEE